MRSCSFEVSAAHQAHDERYDEENQEYEEKNLRYGRRSACNAAEAEHAGNQCHDEEYQSVIQHGDLLCVGLT